MSAREERCKTCRYFRAWHDGGDGGECMRHPPAPVWVLTRTPEIGYAGWDGIDARPRVGLKDFCGEWRAP